MRVSDELFACPFCGEKERIFPTCHPGVEEPLKDDTLMKREFYVECEFCGCRGPRIYGFADIDSGLSAAEEEWNRSLDGLYCDVI